ncbi:MAG: DNA processing protein [Parcubacteria group bacterium Gr01-1014_38]|nr:MAG: DNA processing protein [Parcubacteria group bacterium Gr01-1014_38]
MSNASMVHGLSALRPRVSAVRLRTLVRFAGSVEAAWNAGDALLEAAGFTTEAREVFAAHRRTWEVDAEAHRLHEGGITLVSESSPDYPELLRHIYDPPLALYVRGAFPPEGTRVAVVGSRNASPYGRSVTHALVRPLAARGCTIVSGLAYGIDAEAHHASLAVHGRTIAILGSSVDDASLYPRAHRALAAEIVAQGGAVVSEFPPGTGARPEHFPQRNRLLAGMSHAVVVIEASATSGALITARLALEENREVLAVPGPITSPLSAGTHRLIKEGAAPACSAEDVLEALALRDVLALPRAAEAAPAARALAHPEGAPTETADRILQILTLDPQPIDAVIAASTLPPHEASAALSLLELQGLARDVGGKQYVRC